MSSESSAGEDREAVKQGFLRAEGLGAARRERLAGDASTRAYERLYPAQGPSLILMDQPPRAETQPCPPHATAEERRALGFNALYRLASGRIEAFVAVAEWLRSQGLSAPRIVAADAGAGLAVLEDLGDGLFGPLIAAGAAPEAPLYETAVDVLLRLHATAAPTHLEARGFSWPLLEYDALALATAGELFTEWAPRFHPGLTLGPEAKAAWEAYWTPVMAQAERQAQVFCHRDFHAENLLWLPDRDDVARVGLIDFQDAVRAHPAWDLSMLLHDARRDVSADLERAVLARYLGARPELNRAEFVADYHRLGALNILRIVGIFSRLVVRDGKPRYAALLPRLWTYLDRCLADPALSPLADWFTRFAPPAALAMTGSA